MIWLLICLALTCLGITVLLIVARPSAQVPHPTIVLSGMMESGRTTFAVALTSLLEFEREWPFLPDSETMEFGRNAIEWLQEGSKLPSTRRFLQSESGLDGAAFFGTYRFVKRSIGVGRNRPLLRQRLAGFDLIDAAGEIWSEIAEELRGLDKVDKIEGGLFERVKAAHAIMIFFRASDLVDNPGRIQETVTNTLVMILAAISETRRGFPICMVFTQCDAKKAPVLETVLEALASEGDGGGHLGSAIPLGTSFSESVESLKRFMAVVGAMGGVVEFFCASSLELLLDMGVLTRAQTLAVSQGFAPRGVGLDLVAPVRWCVKNAGRS